jgi:2,4-dienoyl-CoA reductase-like NADH-dependent reductase (Old Yellow Enzyme family)
MSDILLFQPLTLRDVTLRNRVVVSPMCQYSAVDGVPQDWHFAHLGRFAIGGAGAVFVEATGVLPEGRISHGDVGLWNDQQQAALTRIAAFLKSQGATPGIQLAHAGRKASTHRPWQGRNPVTADNALAGEPAWITQAPSAIPFEDSWPTPQALDEAGLQRIKAAFVAAAQRADAAGFDIVEVHAAHGYLLHQFLSPLSNHRADAYGGDREARMRFPLEVIGAVRDVWPEEKPLFVRVSAIDWVEGGLTIEDTIAFATALKALEVDLVDVSSGGLVNPGPGVIPSEPGYQVAFADAVREGAEIATMAVGLIVDPYQAETILANEQADLVALARAHLDDPNWAQHAKAALLPESVGDDAWPAPIGYAVKALHRALSAS